jgi:ABC-type sulfate transport system permease subunit
LSRYALLIEHALLYLRLPVMIVSWKTLRSRTERFASTLKRPQWLRAFDLKESFIPRFLNPPL